MLFVKVAYLLVVISELFSNLMLEFPILGNSQITEILSHCFKMQLSTVDDNIHLILIILIIDLFDSVFPLPTFLSPGLFQVIIYYWHGATSVLTG